MHIQLFPLRKKKLMSVITMFGIGPLGVVEAMHKYVIEHCVQIVTALVLLLLIIA